MAAGTSYTKRYAGGFADKPSTASPIDSTFLNAVETALLQLIGQAPSVDGQVAQWDSANTRFGPALILNKNVDPAAAIASSKIDFTGGNALTNAAIAGAAAIARSKLDFGSGLVNADIGAVAAIARSKLADVSLQVGKAALQSITNSTVTTIAWDVVNHNSGAFVNTAGVITVPNAGIYAVVMQGAWAANATGIRSLIISASATPYGNALWENDSPATAAGSMNQTLSVLVPLAAGATISAQVFQTSGGALNFTPSSLEVVQVS
jgi:hypothetical protein